ncbi:dTDP-L-rhamnose 4-epimerase [Saccharopolyspora spinosa]|uniref:dTDP-L-rhamnose 4-epimerase n=1 Tax=Saccharopolyspora spinosa TaxID=60894 RepID=A0A2N3Y3Y8_SACSN|nr:dTDP-L-rhamnose 4-epimerase [Saccharopolyspora spinosa]
MLVTGGAGFIGTHLARMLLEAGHGVRVLDALLDAAHGASAPAPPTAGVEFVHGDVRDPATVEAALRGVDAVCHQAAMVGAGKDFGDAPDYVECNDLGSAVLLSAMARQRVRTLVLAGSMVVYGEGRYACARHGTVRPGPRQIEDLTAGRFEPACPRCASALTPELVSEDAPPDPRTVYAATKIAQEYLAACWARDSGGRVIALRYHNVYGPGMPCDTPYAGVASLFRSALARGEPPRVFEDGGQRRDFIHVQDIAAANLAALTGLDGLLPPGTLRAYNVGSGTPHTVGEMATALASSGGPQPTITGEYRLGDVRHITACSARLRAELGWLPQVSFAEGMREFADAPLRESTARMPAE